MFYFAGIVEMPPFSKKVIPFADLVEIEGQKAKGCTVHEYLVDTPFYHITLHTDTGRIIQIQDKITKRDLLNQDLNLHSGWECVYDTADTFVQWMWIN